MTQRDAPRLVAEISCVRLVLPILNWFFPPWQKPVCCLSPAQDPLLLLAFFFSSSLYRSVFLPSPNLSTSYLPQEVILE